MPSNCLKELMDQVKLYFIKSIVFFSERSNSETAISLSPIHPKHAVNRPAFPQAEGVIVEKTRSFDDNVFFY